MPNRDEHILEAMLLGPVVVDVARGDDREPESLSEPTQIPDPASVALRLIVLEFEEEVPWPVCVEEAAEHRLAVGDTPVERGEDRAPTTPREADQTLGPVGIEERGEWQPGSATLALHVRLRHEAAQVGVSPGSLGEDRPADEEKPDHRGEGDEARELGLASDRGRDEGS